MGQAINFYTKIETIKNQWDDFVPDLAFWKSSFHTSVEQSGPKGMKPLYCLVEEKNIVVAAFYMQYKRINLGESIRFKNDSIFNKVYQKLVLNNLAQTTLVMGNMLVTGNYGMHYPSKNNIETFALAEEVIAKGIEFLANNKLAKIGPILIKDFFTDEVEGIDNFAKSVKFKVQPNMIFELNPSWSKMEDYVAALKAKPRTKYNKTRSLFQSIQSINLDLPALEKYKDEMHKLYLNISSNAGFNLFYLEKEYFMCLKKTLGDAFIVTGYFENEKLIGFSTLIKHRTEIDAHFLGYDFESNSQLSLYLNMLYDMTEYAINKNASTVIFSRTAMEIKSSVGAKAHDMYCFLTHTNRFYNKLTPKVVNQLYKEVEWTERNPFK